jgi:hypothetical protein
MKGQEPQFLTTYRHKNHLFILFVACFQILFIVQASAGFLEQQRSLINKFLLPASVTGLQSPNTKQ